MQLDNNLAEAHCTFGLLNSWYDLDWDGADREFQIALKLDPSHLTTAVAISVSERILAVRRIRRIREAGPRIGTLVPSD